MSDPQAAVHLTARDSIANAAMEVAAAVKWLNECIDDAAASRENVRLAREELREKRDRLNDVIERAVEDD